MHGDSSTINKFSCYFGNHLEVPSYMFFLGMEISNHYPHHTRPSILPWTRKSFLYIVDFGSNLLRNFIRRLSIFQHLERDQSILNTKYFEQLRMSFDELKQVLNFLLLPWNRIPKLLHPIMHEGIVNFQSIVPSSQSHNPIFIVNHIRLPCECIFKECEFSVDST